ncbi:glycosyltransferase family 2 protein [Azoarcus sp. KH32C]|uniref:glycosyltransferase family 2 protein n=1 Tax=Azoarcus sp. KH32C TaxID=748247 RepID=UPI0002386B11|nr:glycosyltransferase family 2 protein [Azoarcus sp. KH32C]BAL23277.1 glycosyltransferase family protein [Azoarcus sp. KH32C]
MGHLAEDPVIAVAPRMLRGDVRPLVSVVIPTYNRAHAIGACIDSVLAQTLQHFEIVVVDDASRDDTRARVEAIADPRIRYVAHAQNRGGAAARNTGVRVAGGDFIAFLDSDDSWAPRKLEQQIALLGDRGPEYGVAYTWFIGRDKEGHEVSRSDHSLDGRVADTLLVANYVGTFSSIVVRRDLLEQVGGLDEGLRSCQDWDLSIRLSRVTKICCVNEYLVSYLHNGADKHRISSNPASLIQGHRRMLEKFADDYARLPRDKAARAFAGFLDVFAGAGSFADVMRLGTRIVATTRDPRGVSQCCMAMARAAKRRLTRKFGY